MHLAELYTVELLEAWSKKYKKSINCSNPKGFSQRAHCAGRKKRKAGGTTKSKSVSQIRYLPPWASIKKKLRVILFDVSLLSQECQVLPFFPQKTNVEFGTHGDSLTKVFGSWDVYILVPTFLLGVMQVTLLQNLDCFSSCISKRYGSGGVIEIQAYTV